MFYPRIEVFIDSNLLTLMPNIDVNSPSSKHFDRENERRAFEQLLELRKQAKIKVVARGEAIDDFTAIEDQQRRAKMLEYYLNRISKSYSFVFAGEELADLIKKSQDILSKGGEQQDDIALFTLTYIVDTQFTHLVTCDISFHKKWPQYLNKLKQYKKLYKHIEFRRRYKPYFVGCPSEVLKNVRERLDYYNCEC